MFRALTAGVRRSLDSVFETKATTKTASTTVAKNPGVRQWLSDGAKQIEEQYAQSLSILHWLIAAGFVGCVATVSD